MTKRLFCLQVLMTVLCAFQMTAWANPSAPVNLSLNNAPPTTKSIEQYGITWTFAEPVQFGQFVNGDYWVIDPGDGVRIIDIDPLSTEIGGRIMHGSMLNPTVSSNGYDNTLSNIAYDPALNAGRPDGMDLSSTNPLTIRGNASLVSSRTNEEPNHRPQLVDAAVLTILTSIPPSGSFRPPYAGTDKSLNWNLSDIQWQLLPGLPKAVITNLPDLKELAGKIERVWLDHGGGVWTGRELHPSNNMPDYGRDMAIITGDAALALLLDFAQEELQPLLINFLQLGVDWYGVTANSPDIFNTTTQGGLWMGGGGHGHGRKWPVLFTGLMFNDQSILNYCNGAKFPIFQEEQQHFFVAQSDVNLPRYTTDGRKRLPYTSEMIGTPEWGEQHFTQPERDASNWDALYRETVSKSIFGHYIAAKIMNSDNIWNWNSFFGYYQRWYVYSYSNNQSVSYSYFVEEITALFSDYIN